MAVQILDTFPPGTARGNTCYACGAAPRELGPDQRERVVDFHQEIEYEGFLMICETCIVEAARLLGMCTAVDLDAHLANVAELRVELTAAVERAVAAERLAGELRAYDASRAVAPSEPGFDATVEAEAVTEARPEPERDAEADADATEPEPNIEPEPDPEPKIEAEVDIVPPKAPKTGKGGRGK